MKSLPFVLTTLLFLGVAPYAMAVDGSCSSQAPKEETLAHPMGGGRYLVVDTDDMTKTGEWTEFNGVDGLQTDECKVGNFRFYAKDVQSVVLP